MLIKDSGHNGSQRYEATSGHLWGTGATPGQAARDLDRKERELQAARDRNWRFLADCFDRYAFPWLVKAFRACCNLVIRPIPTLAIGAAFRAMHWLAMLAVPAGSWWAWGAHAFFGYTAAVAMADHARDLEEIEGMVIKDFTREWHVAYQVVYWGYMAGSLAASGYVAGVAFDWLAAHGYLQADAYPHFRDAVQLAAGAATLVWRCDHHPSLKRPAIPWFD